jgi:NAD(P)-dependent dehydrogenase (short-subunit alcohol dehydrogenase family)
MSSDKKLALVTGGTSGIGKELVYSLAIRNVDVVFTARNPTKAQSVVSELQERVSAVSATRNVGSISWIFCDLNDLDSVYKCALEFKKAHSSLHIFVNNAGAVVPSFELNKDGYEANFSSNYLGHFLLTLELLAMLKSTAQELKEKSIGTESDGVRIIITSSFLHKRYNQDLLLDHRLHDAKTYGGGWKAYGRSKLMSLLFMKLLKEKVDAFGDLPLYVNAVHPGTTIP